MLEESILQASLGVQLGGLGLRSAVASALPSFIFSKLSAKPIVARLAASLQNLDMLPEGFENDYCNSLSTALTKFKEGFDPSTVETIEQLISSEAIFSEKLFQAVEAGHALPTRTQNGTADVIDLLVAPVGSEDPERAAASGLQGTLLQIVDKRRSQTLRHQFTVAEKWEDIWRIDELQDGSVSHEWLWMLHPCHGELVPPDEYADAVRVRLGAKFTDDVTSCERCGKMMGCSARHALCCALPEATRGHNKTRDKILDLVSISDPSACREAPELVPSFPTIRPADILTDAALPGGRTALDIGVATPGTCTAGDDACDSMWSEKFRHY